MDERTAKEEAKRIPYGMTRYVPLFDTRLFQIASVSLS